MNSDKFLRPQQKQSVIEKRRYNRIVNDLKELCEEHNIQLYNYDEAEPDMICTLSMNDYELGDERSICSEGNESYFVTEDNLDKLNRIIESNLGDE